MLQVEVRLKGQIDQSWSDWFDGLAIRYAEGDQTVMSGPIADQAALYGLVSKLRDIGLPLLSIQLVEENHPSSATNHDHHLSVGGSLS